MKRHLQLAEEFNRLGSVAEAAGEVSQDRDPLGTVARGESLEISDENAILCLLYTSDAADE